MKKSRFTDSQIIDALKRAEAGLAVPGLCSELGISAADVLQVACQIRRHGCIFNGPHEEAGRREPPPVQDVHRRKAQGRGGSEALVKKW